MYPKNIARSSPVDSKFIETRALAGPAEPAVRVVNALVTVWDIAFEDTSGK